MRNDEYFMAEAIRLSKLAMEHGNEPFGAVLVKNGEIVETNENQIYSKMDPTEHAELGLIRKFCKKTGIYRLQEYTLYTSCEPCFMCSGAMVWTKLGRLVYAVSNIQLEAIMNKKGSECSRITFAHSNHKPEVTGGILKEESLQILEDYFKKE
jgi:tRNA(Arg) A34 adenosine deaminase TadA